LAWLIPDISAGVILTAILIPVGMGYAEAAGLPAIYGLYSTIVALVAYAIFGSSRILIVGPDSALIPLIAATILPLAKGDPSQTIAIASCLARWATSSRLRKLACISWLLITKWI
jgi:MFS superfamily sulfate permease-like transporter